MRNAKRVSTCVASILCATTIAGCSSSTTAESAGPGESVAPSVSREAGIFTKQIRICVGNKLSVPFTMNPAYGLTKETESVTLKPTQFNCMEGNGAASTRWFRADDLAITLQSGNEFITLVGTNSMLQAPSLVACDGDVDSSGGDVKCFDGVTHATRGMFEGDSFTFDMNAVTLAVTRAKDTDTKEFSVSVTPK